MKVIEIRSFPTSLDVGYVKRWRNCAGLHESLLRSYQTLEYVKELLKVDTPAAVILDLIDLCYAQIPSETENETARAFREIKEFTDTPIFTVKTQKATKTPRRKKK